MTQIIPGAGVLLIADPFLKDPNFRRTVVFLCEHQNEGSFGFVLNRNYEFTLDRQRTPCQGFAAVAFHVCVWANESNRLSFDIGAETCLVLTIGL